MKCPVCKSELIVLEQKYLETLIEHVENIPPSLKDSYICSNSNCASHKFNIHWNEYGETYSDFSNREFFQFIDNNNAPFGSYQRKSNVEIYKKDENKKYKIFGWTLEIEWKYKSNLDGDILSKKPKLVLWTPEHTMYISGISMLVFLLQKHFKNPG